MAGMSAPFAYLFERFPSYVQTFCYREVAEMWRQVPGLQVWAVRRPGDPRDAEVELPVETFYLPEKDEVRAGTRVPFLLRLRVDKRLRAKDSDHMHEALWLGPRLKAAGIRHVHAHFGGIATRVAWWLKMTHKITYSYTGHANDIFVESGSVLTNRMLAEAAEFIVTETDHARVWMENAHPKTRGRVFRVFNGIEPDGFLPRDVPQGRPRILSVGRLVEKKGYGVLIEACARLRSQGVDFLCEIAGDGPLEDELRGQIARLGLETCVALLGPRSQSDVRALLARCTVFALACVPDSEGGSDNLPTVVMEAMFAGAPVISTRLAGVPEMIESGKEGILVPAGDAASLAESIQRLLQNPEERTAFAVAARRKAEANFTIAANAAELRRLLAPYLQH